MSAPSPAPLTLRSAAFADGAPIPSQYTCDGADRSPPLAWSAAPPATKTFALICDDPDAPGRTWVHWVLFDLPVGVTDLPESVAKTGTLENLGNATQGTNTGSKIGYSGPCPPPVKPHRYFFKLYALDAVLGLRAGATKAQVEQAMRGHVLAEAKLIGTYGRKG